MKSTVRIFLSVIVAFISASILAMPVSANVDDFSFSSYDADYYLSKDSEGHSTLKVVERLTAEFKNYNQNRGILRAVPRNYDGHPVSFQFESMQRNGVIEPVHEIKQEQDFYVISTRRNEFVNGTQEYTFTYTLKDVTKTFGDHQELYWDTNGTGWGQRFDLLTARVHLDDTVRKSFTGAVSCYEGTDRSNKSCHYFSTKDPDEEVIFFTASGPLLAHENLTYDLSFKANTFAGYQMGVVDYIPLALVSAAVLMLIVAIIIKIRYGRNFPGRGTIIAEYTPPKNISIFMAAEISGDSTATTAQLLNLAVRKKIRIIEADKKTWGIFSNKEYALELIDTTGLEPDEARFLRIFFRGSVVGSKYTMKRNDSAKGMQISLLQKAISKEAQEQGYRKKQKKQTIIQGVVISALFVFLFAAFMVSQSITSSIGFFVTFLVGTVALLLIVFAKLADLKPLTESGRSLYDYLKGLKLYIKMAEADRIKFLQSPEGAEKEKIDTSDNAQMVILYERLLPYAVLFGQEKQWLKELGRYYETTETNPGWYSGNGSFNAAYFASSVGSFSSYSSSSSFSSSSGAGGGGSSGGGGGGGGGGGC